MGDKMNHSARRRTYWRVAKGFSAVFAILQTARTTSLPPRQTKTLAETQTWI
jgi:hypothetical protein